MVIPHFLKTKQKEWEASPLPTLRFPIQPETADRYRMLPGAEAQGIVGIGIIAMSIIRIIIP